MRYLLPQFFFFLFCFLVAVLILLGNAMLFSYSKGTYQQLINRHQAEIFSKTDRNQLIHSIYQGLTQQKSIQTILENGDTAFSIKEIIHMQDVAKLLRALLWITFILFFLLLFWYRWYQRMRYPGLTFFPLYSLLFAFLFIVLIISTFSSSFTWFHEISFTNDFWLLNEETDLLIRLFPFSFFVITFIKIGVISLLELFLLSLGRRFVSP